jgi:hypothetical protein
VKKYGLLDAFDAIFARAFTCFLPPPYDTAWETSEKIDMAIDQAARNSQRQRKLIKRRKK